MELRLPCIKPLKFYVVDGNRSIKCSYKSDAMGGKQGYFSFLGTATLSEATKQAEVAGAPVVVISERQTKTQPAAMKWLP